MKNKLVLSSEEMHALRKTFVRGWAGDALNERNSAGSVVGIWVAEMLLGEGFAEHVIVVQDEQSCLTLAVDQAHAIAEHLGLITAAIHADVAIEEAIEERSGSRMKAYTINQPQIAELATAIALMDWIKNALPDASPEKAEAAVRATRCHAILEEVLYDDAPAVYGTAEPEEIQP